MAASTNVVAQPPVAFPGRADPAFPRALMMAGAEAAPTHQMPIQRKGAHVQADVCHDAFNRPLVHLRDRIQRRQHRRERAKRLGDGLTQLFDGFLQIIEVSQHLADQQCMVLPKPPHQRLPARGQPGESVSNHHLPNASMPRCTTQRSFNARCERTYSCQ